LSASLVDPHLSKYWAFRADERKNGTVGWLFFEEFVSDPLFYDRLTDRVDADVRVFQDRKRLMDEEFNEGG
jgi:hypothetical protein